uniref:Uncharacterized protein n=1 Tax=Trichogramma kaykai TaxID=54128 RepID=A0ABD2X046_9HYME
MLDVDAVLRLKGSGNLLAIQINKKRGGTLTDSFLDEGFLLDKKPDMCQPQKIIDANILIANTFTNTDKIMDFGNVVEVSKSEDPAFTVKGHFYEHFDDNDDPDSRPNVKKFNLEMAKKLGADGELLIVNPDSTEENIKNINTLFEGFPNITIDATGVQSTINLALLFCNRNYCVRDRRPDSRQHQPGTRDRRIDSTAAQQHQQHQQHQLSGISSVSTAAAEQQQPSHSPASKYHQPK